MELKTGKWVQTKRNDEWEDAMENAIHENRDGFLRLSVEEG